MDFVKSSLFFVAELEIDNTVDFQPTTKALKVVDWAFSDVLDDPLGLAIGGLSILGEKASECQADCLCFSKPYANPQVSPTHGVVGAAGLTVAANGAGSQVKPFEGKAPIYKWTSDEGGESNEINSSFTFTTGGLHKITLRLTEGCSLLWDESSVYVEVTRAFFTASETEGLTPLAVQFNAADSYPPAGSTGVTYEWSTTAPGVTLSQNVASQSVTFENQPGHKEDKYTVTLTVKNTVEEDDGTVKEDVDSFSQEITVGGDPVITVSAVEGTTPVGSGGKVEAFKVAEIGVEQTVFFNLGNEEGLGDLLVESVNEWDPDLVVNSYSTSPIPPKGYGQFSLTWTPTKDHLQLSATVTVKSNDPATPEFTFTVTGGGDPCQGTVTYEGREWQKCGSSSSMNWDAANAYCAAATTGGYDDWFLPSIDTLKSLIVCSNGTQVTGWYNTGGVSTIPWDCGGDYSGGYYFSYIDPAFTSFSHSSYWSSTTNEINSDHAWSVHFGSGGVYKTGYKTSLRYVRCVRGGQ